MTRHTTTIPSMTIGDRLRRSRKAAGIKSGQMAVLLSVDANTISNYENDRITNYPMTRMRRWAEVTGVPVDWLLGGSEQAMQVRPCGLRYWRVADELLPLAAAA